MNFKIFVYGSLRQGERAHNLLQNSPCIATVAQAKGYKLYSCGGFPTLVPTHNPLDIVWGELYEVSSDVLKTLDEYEGVKEKEYSRFFDPELSAYLFVVGERTPPVFDWIPSGNWNDRPSV